MAKTRSTRREKHRLAPVRQPDMHQRHPPPRASRVRESENRQKQTAHDQVLLVFAILELPVGRPAGRRRRMRTTASFLRFFVPSTLPWVRFSVTVSDVRVTPGRNNEPHSDPTPMRSSQRSHLSTDMIRCRAAHRRSSESAVDARVVGFVLPQQSLHCHAS